MTAQTMTRDPPDGKVTGGRTNNRPPPSMLDCEEALRVIHAQSITLDLMLTASPTTIEEIYAVSLAATAHRASVACALKAWDAAVAAVRSTSQ